MTNLLQKSGGCQCGRVRYTASVDPAEAYLCHCRMCQRATGGFAASFVSVEQADVDWDGEPDFYESSPIAERPFCARCGTPLGFRFKTGSTKMDLTVGSFDDPGDFVPKHHFGAESLHEAWLDTSALPRIRTDEYEVLVQKWRQAGVEPPP
ncbi:GFA family protein [Altererythrobacter aerius]|uniref:GFA family protein n=1 Tax=Tsuneonella aeria TaxID=1837929 RepID=A0A6I4TCG4_9SPHN|nr:GFA family protein [Tsuneonella aeria]MXO73915.1 GFA family protein [Tsuneonella aeria]